MKSHFTPGSLPPALQRAMAGMLAVTVSSVLLALMLVLFDDASSMSWLTPTQAHQQLLAPCEQMLGSAARRHCVESVVAAVQARASDVLMASQSALPPQTTVR